MNIQKIPLSETGAFKGIFLDYIGKHSILKPFYGNFPSLDGLAEQISNKSLNSDIRATLVKELKLQYEGISIDEGVNKNIESLLEEETYTITTGHQLNIFTGPLYFIYKIISVINLCEQLKARFPDKNFVPIYWMASEDHDYDEIKSFNLFGKKYTWETEQTGAVGKFDPSSIAAVINELPESTSLFETAYLKSQNLAQATRKIVNELFGKYGLVCLDGDSRGLKSIFQNVIIDDLQNHKANDLSEKTSEKLNEQGYQPQVYPRSINLFYNENGIRQRIVKDQDLYKVKDTDISFTHEEIIQLVNEKPEVFSPNVILRPLYQEMILPNLAYIGGPAEVAYWLQLKSIFDNYHVPFPILIPRNFALVINKGLSNKISKLGIEPSDLFKDFQQLKEEFVKKHADGELSIDHEIKEINKVFEIIKSTGVEVDKSLEGFIASEQSKTNKSLENISKRLQKAEEKKQETEVNQLENLKNKLFPDGSLQERHDNFLNFYLNNPQFIEELKSVFDPLDFTFNVISYNE